MFKSYYLVFYFILTSFNYKISIYFMKFSKSLEIFFNLSGPEWMSCVTTFKNQYWYYENFYLKILEENEHINENINIQALLLIVNIFWPDANIVLSAKLKTIKSIISVLLIN